MKLPLINTLSPLHFTDYELIDSGGYEKLERFGKFITARPEPQAVWPKAMAESEWDNLAHAQFRREGNDAEKGRWFAKPEMPDHWPVNYHFGQHKFRMKLSLSSFKHVGIFPEQAVNWDYIFEHLEKRKSVKPNKAKVLNLFAYTGAASLAANAAGAEVSHVDSVKQVISWARENMEQSGQNDVRWVVEDAMKFVKREVRRGNRYQGIILDPPAYGRGPEGEKWLLEEHIFEMLENCAKLIDSEDYFFIINLYSLGFSALIVQNLIEAIFGKKPNAEFGELFLPDKAGRNLPLGTYYRFRSWA